MKIYIFCFFVAISRFSSIIAQSGVCPDPSTDHLFDATCFEFAEMPPRDQMTWQAASTFCQNRNKTLAIIHTTSEQQKVADRFASLNWDRAIIGLKYKRQGWKWADQSPLLVRGQGCHEVKDIDTSRSSTEYNARTMSQDSCIAFCSKGGHQFAAVMAGAYCYCSKEFIWRQPASTCNLPCAGASDQFCGSYTTSYVYYTAEFSYDNWQRGRPSVGGSCAAIQVDNVNNNWVDVSCTFARPFLCMYDITNTVPKLNVRESTCGNNDTCYYLYNQPQLNWADANRYCSKFGGRLATVDSQERQDMINTLMARVTNISQVWIGASNNDWYFNDSTVPTFRGWISADEPAFPNVLSCAEAVVTTLRTTDGPVFGWKSRTCNHIEGFPNRMICSAPAKFQPTTAKPGSRPQGTARFSGSENYEIDLTATDEYGNLLNKTRRPTNNTNTTTTPVDDNLSTVPPDAQIGLLPNSSTVDKGFPWWGILLIVLLGLILIAALLVVIVFFLKKSKRISPSLKNRSRRREATSTAITIDKDPKTRDQTMLY